MLGPSGRRHRISPIPEISCSFEHIPLYAIIEIMACSGKIVDLRALLAERFPTAAPPPRDFLLTGLATVDASAGGGLRKGCITELISPNLSAGSASFIAAMIQAAHRDRYFVALIDGQDSFDPQPLENTALRHVFWVRCRTTLEAMKSADLLLRDGN